MTVTISLTPEVEVKLQEAPAATGKDFPTLVREALEEKLASGNGASPESKPSEQWLAEFNAWMKDVAVRGRSYPADFVLDDSRESIYEGHSSYAEISVVTPEAAIL